jgi:hypothetical protein
MPSVRLILSRVHSPATSFLGVDVSDMRQKLVLLGRISPTDVKRTRMDVHIYSTRCSDLGLVACIDNCGTSAKREVTRGLAPSRRMQRSSSQQQRDQVSRRVKRACVPCPVTAATIDHLTDTPVRPFPVFTLRSVQNHTRHYPASSATLYSWHS